MRLIDADALHEHFKEHEKAARNYRAFESADSWGGAVHDVEDAPAIDAEPVRHGTWKEPYPYDICDCYECSCCGEKQDYTYNYCPDCGAKMDVEVQDEKH